MDKVLVEIYVPGIEQKFDMWLPIHKKIGNIINLLLKSLGEMYENNLVTSDAPLLYNMETSFPYSINLMLNETDIKNGTKLILI